MKIKEKVIKYKLLIENFGYLSLLQIVVLLVPLITYPYLIKVLGSEIYGLVVFMQSIMAFFTILINFGLNIFSTKDVAINKNNKDKLSEVFTIVLIIKTVLFIVGMLILTLLCVTIDVFKDNILLCFICYSVCISEVVFPVWFYQGIEKMKYTTLINVFSKLVFTMLLYLIIKEESDYLWFSGLLSLGALVGGVVSFYLIFKVEKLVIKKINISEVISYMKRSFPFFMSRVAAVLSVQINAILIGGFIGMTEVAYYDLAKKIIELFKIPNSLINKTVYPKIARERNTVFVKKIFIIRLIVSLMLYLVMFLSGEFIVGFLGGKEMLDVVNLLYLFGLLIPLTGITYYLGGTVLVSFNYESKFNLSVVYSTLFYLCMSFCLYLMNEITIINLIYLIVITEFLLVIYRYYYCKIYKII